MSQKNPKSRIFVDAIEIGLRIKKFRVKAGFTQEQLAELINLSPQQIQKYESGGSRLNTDKLQELSIILNVSIFDFFEGLGDYPFVLSAKEKRLINTFRMISDDKIRDGYLLVLESTVEKSRL